MEVIKMEKTVNYGENKVNITVDIELDAQDFAVFDYSGFDLIPDEHIPDVLIAVGRIYKNRIKKGKILADAVRSLV